jgi:hypothetical protein
MRDDRVVAKRVLIALALCSVLSTAKPAQAQEPSAPPPGQPPAGAAASPQKPNRGQWWLKYARDIDPRPPEWLFHAEGQGSFANNTGSVSGFEYTLDLLAAERKGLVTNQTGVSFILQEARVADAPGGGFKQKSVKASNLVFVNVAKPINLVTAVIWEKDDPKHVVHRISIFEGVEHNFDVGPGRVIGLGAALGWETEHLITPDGVYDERGAIVYVQNTFATPIAKRGGFSHHLEFFFDLANTGDIRVNWDLSLTLQVNSHIGIGPAAKIRYDAHPVVQVQRTDTMAIIAVQFK